MNNPSKKEIRSKDEINRWLAEEFLEWHVEGSRWINKNDCFRGVVDEEDFFDPYGFVLILEVCLENGAQVTFSVNQEIPGVPKSPFDFACSVSKLGENRKLFAGSWASNCKYDALYGALMRAFA